MTEHNTSGGLTEGERLLSPLDDFLRAFREDDNDWWRIPCGDHLNIFEEAVERMESAEAENARLRAAWEGLMSDSTRRLMAQEYLIDRGDYHGQDITRHAQAMLAALRAAFDSPPTHTQQEGLAVCELDHGGDGNPARVYGHHASPRTCIRIKKTNEWVYDPAWENNDD